MERGRPDYFINWYGKFVAIETKLDSKKYTASAIQNYQIAVINLQGGHGLVSDNIEEIKQFLLLLIP